MYTTDKNGISLFVEALSSSGIKRVICSPGSRNAPLIIAIDNNPNFETVVIHDERVAAFYALGMADQLKEPVAVVCTSGSAMLNYYPAVAEAYYRAVPLVVITADRPEEWVNHGDGQTIVQKNVYKNHIRFEATIPEFLKDETDKLEMLSTVHEAFNKGNGNWKGPIHFNVPLSEPLYNIVEKGLEVFDLSEVVLKDNELLSDNFINDWKQSNKRMILCGQMSDVNGINDLLDILSEDSSIAVIVEHTSNVTGKRYVHCIDRTLSAISENEISSFQPDLLITIGGAIISKRIKKFLRESDGLIHYKIGHEFPEMDTYRALKGTIRSKPALALKEIIKVNQNQHSSTFGSKWKQKDLAYALKTEEYLENVSYSDLKAIEFIHDCIPENSVLHMGNSSVVRYCQLFEPVKSVKYYSNRGTSGIDGSLSTACGAALADPKNLHVLIIGDVSFFYDSNALWNKDIPNNLRIFLINNNGGGIFRIIEGPNSIDQREKYFEAPHAFSAQHICKAFDADYYSANNMEELEGVMREIFDDNNKIGLVEVFTPSESNAKILEGFFKLNYLQDS